MNRKLSFKMSAIASQFARAGKPLPIATNRYEIVPAKFEGHKGVFVKGIFVWGVSPREYWKYCRLVG